MPDRRKRHSDADWNAIFERNHGGADSRDRSQIIGETMSVDGMVREMKATDLAKCFDCTGRERTGCLLRSKVTVGGLPFCLRCGRRESRKIAAINAERTKAA